MVSPSRTNCLAMYATGAHRPTAGTQGRAPMTCKSSSNRERLARCRRFILPATIRVVDRAGTVLPIPPLAGFPRSPFRRGGAGGRHAPSYRGCRTLPSSTRCRSGSSRCRRTRTGASLRQALRRGQVPSAIIMKTRARSSPSAPSTPLASGVRCACPCSSSRMMMLARCVARFSAAAAAGGRDWPLLASSIARRAARTSRTRSQSASSTRSSSASKPCARSQLPASTGVPSASGRWPSRSSELTKAASNWAASGIATFVPMFAVP